MHLRGITISKKVRSSSMPLYVKPHIPAHTPQSKTLPRLYELYKGTRSPSPLLDFLKSPPYAHFTATAKPVYLI